MSDTDKKEAIYLRHQVIELLEQAAAIMAERGLEVGRELANHVHSLGNEITLLRQEMTALSPADLLQDSLPSMSDELEAVVKHTEEATETILGACDVLEEEMAKGEFSKDNAQAQITKIVEACAFQDITGQRVQKVVLTVKNIESKLSEIHEYLEQRFPGAGAISEASKLDKADPEKRAAKKANDENLMKGPQLPDKALNQDDIDALLRMMD